MSRTTKYTQEQINRVKALLIAHSVREIAEMVGIPKSTVHWIGKQHDSRADISPDGRP